MKFINFAIGLTIVGFSQIKNELLIIKCKYYCNNKK